MPVTCVLRTKRFVWLLVYTVICFGLGLWGAYDYWVRIPHDEQRYKEFESVKGTFDSLQKKADEGKSLSAEERVAYEDSKKLMAGFQPPPTPVPAWDRPLQLYVYVIGCGILSAPWFLRSLLKVRGKRVELTELSDAGILRSGNITIEVREAIEIDMSRWMSKSIATVRGPGGATIEIDDYMLEDGAKVVGFFAHRFSPAEWTTEAKRVTAAPDDSEVAPNDSAASPTEQS